MKLDIEDKKALIIGASHGVGFALAQKLLNEGVNVCGVARRKEALTLLGSNEHHAKFIALPLDLMPRASEHELFSFLKKKDFFPDIIAHCFGGNDIEKTGENIEKQWREMYRSNFEIPMLINEFFLPFMRKQHWGRIVSMSSPSALEAQGSVSYCTFKAMITAYSRSKGRLEAKYNIIMSAILPGAFYFPNSRWEKLQEKNPGFVEKFLKLDQKIGRFGSVNEIADFMLFLCSKKASFNAGGIYSVDGGLGSAFFHD